MALTINLEAGLRPPPPPERGTPDGRFVFEKKLGEGAEGQVYLAVPTGGLRRRQQQEAAYSSPIGSTTSTTSTRVPPPPPSSTTTTASSPVAIKVVSGGRAYERCRANRELSRKLVHPNICFPRESWWDNVNGRCFVRMELCETDLLDLVCDEGPLAEGRGSVVVGHLASALSHLHGQGIAHQDVKLENMFVSRDGVAKLGDLGSIVQIFLPPTNTVQEHDGSSSSGSRSSSSSTGSTSSSSDEYSSGAESFAACASSSPPFPSSSSPSFVGSVMYAPPEFNSSSSNMMKMLRSTASVDYNNKNDGDTSDDHHLMNRREKLFAADMWALGVSIWSAMAGCHPWELACVDRSKEFREFVRRGAVATLPRSFSQGMYRYIRAIQQQRSSGS